MENTDLREHIKTMKTVEDLARLLDSIKRVEFDKVRYVISEKMLKHFSSDSLAPKRYRKFHIRKKSGGLREIKAPCYQLEVILTCINSIFKAVYEPSDFAMGFTYGRSVVSNASVHVGHNYVFNIDLKDFFSSIPQGRVWKRLQLPPFNFTQEVANVVAGICCSYDESVDKNVLPQGSPASPLLTNAICDKLDRRMKGVAKRFGLHYTRYADDMTFSSMHNVYQEGGAFRTEIQRIIADQGFRMNDSKTRLQKEGAHQEVTGLTVNSVANVSRKYISDLRWIISVWEKEGYAKAYAKFYPQYKKEKGYIKKGEPVMENVVGGKLNYLRMVKGENNAAYRKLAARFAALQQLVFVDNETDKSRTYVYVQPYSIKEFEELFHTTITFEVSPKKKVLGKCEINKCEKFLALSKSTQKELCPDIDGMSAGDVLPKKKFENCYVTLCRNKGKNFWLITKMELKRSKCLSIQNLNVKPADLLYMWECNGYAFANHRLSQFLQFGSSKDSILEWKEPELEVETTEEESIDRGTFETDNHLLLKHLLRNKHLNNSEKQRFAKLIRQLIDVTTENSDYVDIEMLLDTWENEGLDAAVLKWKEEMKKSDEIKRRMKQNRNKNRRNDSAIVPLFGKGSNGFISKESMKAVAHEMENDSGKKSDLGFSWDDDDIPYAGEDESDYTLKS